MKYVDSNLLSDEQVVFRTQLNSKRFIPLFAILYPICASFITVWLSTILSMNNTTNPASPNTGFGFATFYLAVVSGMPILIIKMRIYTSEFAITNKRVIIKVGWLVHKTFELNISKIESVIMNQGPIDRFFGNGTIMIIGTGCTREILPNISYPLEFRNALVSMMGK